MQIEGKLYDGHSSKEHSVVAEFLDGFLIIKEHNIRVPLEDIDISSRLGNTPRVLELPDSSRVKIEDNDTIDRALKEANLSSSKIHKLERSWKLALTSLILVVATTIFMLTIGADYSAKFLSTRLSPHILDSASKKALKELDKSYLHKSNLSSERKAEIIRLFKKLTAGSKDYTLHFRSSPKMGPNAFMLPSGDTVILDELIFLDKDPHLYGVLGVLAHEKGHYYYKHGIRGLIKGSIATVVIGYITGDISFIATALPTALVTSKYSREFETQADQYAKSELKRLHISSKPLANLFIEMENYYKKRSGSSNKGLEWFASHPVTSKRIEYFNKN